MFKFAIIVMISGFSAFGQSSLILEKNQVAELGKKIVALNLDTLVMKDSSKLVFTRRQALHLRINHLFAGKGCVLDGSGEDGRNGDPPLAPYGGRGAPSYPGNSGWRGDKGANLFLVLDYVELKDTLIIFVPGGNGGNGSPPPVSRSYYRGVPGIGGNGGNGGDVIISHHELTGDVLGHIVIVNHGGRTGQTGSRLRTYGYAPYSPYDHARLNSYWAKHTWSGVSGKITLVPYKD